MCMATELKRCAWLAALVAPAAGLGVQLIGVAAAQAQQSPWEDPVSAGGGGTGTFPLLCGFGVDRLTAYDLLLLGGVALMLLALGFALYRIALEDLIRRGLRPTVLVWTLVTIALGVMLLAAFALIPNVLGLCLFAILAGVFLLYLIAMMLTRKILRGIGLAFLMIAIAVVVLLQFVMV